MQPIFSYFPQGKTHARENPCIERQTSWLPFWSSLLLAPLVPPAQASPMGPRARPELNEEDKEMKSMKTGKKNCLKYSLQYCLTTPFVRGK